MAMPSSIPPPEPVIPSREQTRPSLKSVETIQHAPEQTDIISNGTLKNIWGVVTTVKALLYHALGSKGADSEELTPQEKQIIALAADAAFPNDGPIALSGTEAGIPEYVENYFRRMPPQTRRLLHMLFYFIESSPIVFGPRRRLFSSLSEEEKKKALDFCTKSVYMHRLSLQALRVLLTFGYMANPEIQKQIGCVPNKDPFGLGTKKPEGSQD